MAGEWKQASIGELCDAGAAQLQTGPFGSQLHAYDYVNDGVPVVPTEAIRGRQIDHSVLPKITQTKALELSRHRLRPGDILFARRGVQATGHIGCVRQAENGFICGTGAIRLRVNHSTDEIDADYLSHVLADPASVDWFKFHAIGATMPNLNEGIIRSFPLSIPPLTEQRAIAHTLGTLDDKIEINRRMSETLEAMARALFQAWFVDFEPVRAKIEGRWQRGQSLPGLPAHLYDLFPDRLVDSELGEIPEGWRVGRFADVAEQLRDQENPLSSPDVLFHHFSIPAFDEGQNPKPEYGESIKSLKSRVSAGTTLLSKLNPEIERVWLVDVRPGERAVCSTEFLVLRARPPFTRSFVYCFARSILFRQQIEGLVTGTSKSHQRAQVDSILNLAVVTPPSPIVAAFDRMADSLLARTLECRRESSTLAALRDTLLPKLISGELRVAHDQHGYEEYSP
ncbi:MAG: restriction endonuclease subunit S [Metallibacterium sp.]